MAFLKNWTYFFVKVIVNCKSVKPVILQSNCVCFQYLCIFFRRTCICIWHIWWFNNDWWLIISDKTFLKQHTQMAFLVKCQFQIYLYSTIKTTRVDNVLHNKTEHLYNIITKIQCNKTSSLIICQIKKIVFNLDLKTDSDGAEHSSV